jgi:hypothetical protein
MRDVDSTLKLLLRCAVKAAQKSLMKSDRQQKVDWHNVMEEV